MHGAVVLDLVPGVARDAGPAPAPLRLLARGRDGRQPNADLLAALGRTVELTKGPLGFGEPGPGLKARPAAAAAELAGMASSAGDGLHAAFLGRGVDAATLEWGVGAGAATPAQALQVLQVLEGVVRSLSNIEERLHHASAIYWLVGPRHIVPGAVLFAAAGMLLGALGLEAFGGGAVGTDGRGLCGRLAVHAVCQAAAAIAAAWPANRVLQVLEAGVLAGVAALWALVLAPRSSGACRRGSPTVDPEAGLMLLALVPTALLNPSLVILAVPGLLWTRHASLSACPIPAAVTAWACLQLDAPPALAALAACQAAMAGTRLVDRR